jgi:signal transduction histidine kinase
MELERNQRQARFAWLVLAVLGALSALLAVLQYRWLGEVSYGEKERMRAGVHASLQRLSQDFNNELTLAAAALIAQGPDEEDPAGEATYAARYAAWKENTNHPALFRRVVLIVPRSGGVELRDLDLQHAVFRAGQWPPEWKRLEDRFSALYSTEGDRRPGPRPPSPVNDTLIELPRFNRFGRPGGPGDRPPPRGERNEPRERDPRDRGPREPRPAGMIREWLILEPDPDYLHDTLLTDLLRRHLSTDGESLYHAEVVSRDDPSKLIFRFGNSQSPIGASADATAGIFDVQFEQVARRAGLGRGMGGFAFRGRPPQPSDRSRWQVQVQHRAGSIEAVVSRARLRNFAISMFVLVLMLATAVVMVRSSQRAQALAQLQMDFVAGVSHELRTPLAVIRTAAHNLEAGKFSGERVQRYGRLISAESDRLTSIVEQVLRFAASKAGRPVAAREPVWPRTLIDKALRATESAVTASGCTLERNLPDGLPQVLADPIALEHAIQNLVINAAKYGTEGKWIGVSAEAKQNGSGAAVEIRVADRGAGIPEGEIQQIFDPFYRGKKAIEDQIHGTGLGLSLVKRIIEAHDGTVSVHSAPGKGTEFVLRLPAAPEESLDEFANTAG